MNLNKIKTNFNLTKAYLKQLKGNKFPMWTHLWVTERCNLKCSYCYVRDNDDNDPSTEELKSNISHAKNLGSVVIAFMGGEPTIRDDLSDLVNYTSNLGMLSIVSTNGKISYEKLEDLAKSGLSTLQVSLDGIDEIKGTQKTLSKNPDLIDKLRRIRKEYGLKFFINQVITPNTINETPKLVKLASEQNFPISIGVATNPVHQNQQFREYNDCPFDYLNYPQDYFKKFYQTISWLHNTSLNSKKSPIMNDPRYFLHVNTALNQNIVHLPCDIGKYLIQVATSGNIYKCSKLSEEKDIKFLDIDQSYFTEDKHGSQEILNECDTICLSNCAVQSALTRKYPFARPFGLRKLSSKMYKDNGLGSKSNFPKISYEDPDILITFLPGLKKWFPINSESNYISVTHID